MKVKHDVWVAVRDQYSSAFMDEGASEESAKFTLEDQFVNSKEDYAVKKVGTIEVDFDDANDAAEAYNMAEKMAKDFAHMLEHQKIQQEKETEQLQSDKPWQTRNQAGELKWFETFDMAVGQAIADPTVWKISYRESGHTDGGILRMVKMEDGTWRATFQTKTMGALFHEKLEVTQ